MLFIDRFDDEDGDFFFFFLGGGRVKVGVFGGWLNCVGKDSSIQTFLLISPFWTMELITYRRLLQWQQAMLYEAT